MRGDHGRLCFPAGSFDLVTDRHVGATPAEVLRVLEPGGIYLTQRPGGHICQNIFDALGWGTNEEFRTREQGDDYWNVDRAAKKRWSTTSSSTKSPSPSGSPTPRSLSAGDPDLDRNRLDRLPLRTNWHADLLVVQK